MEKFRNALLSALAGSLPVCLLFSQSGTPNRAAEFDYVQDLQKSAAFYENVMGLQKMAEPFKDGGNLVSHGRAPSTTPSGRRYGALRRIKSTFTLHSGLRRCPILWLTSTNCR